MANRSYLYSTNEISQKDHHPSIINSISEYNYDIPLSYKILLSSQPQITQSIIWPQFCIALQSDYEQGVKNLLSFLSVLEKYIDTADKNEFKNLCDQTQEFLNNNDNKQKYFILEAGEIFELSRTPLETGIEQLLLDVTTVHAKLTLLFTEAQKEKKWYQFSLPDPFAALDYPAFSSLRVNWKTHLGIDNWVNTLYYDFPNKKSNVGLQNASL